MFNIQYFKVKNFKAFRESSVVDLKPLTVLAGVNSSGKSSFIQGLLLLKQSIEKESFPRLHLTGSSKGVYVEFAPFSDAIFRYAHDNDQLGFHIHVQGNMPEKAAQSYFRGELPAPVKDREEGHFPLSLYLEIRFRYDEKWGAMVSSLDCKAFSGDAKGPRLFVSPEPRGKDSIQFFSVSEDWNDQWEELIDFHWPSLFPVRVIVRSQKQNGEEIPEEILVRINEELGLIMYPLRRLSSELENKFHYLESLRPGPRSLYKIDPNPPLFVSAQGEMPFQRLWHEQQKPVETIAPGYDIEEKGLTEAVNRILKTLGIEQPLSILAEGSLGFQIRFNTIGGEKSVSIPHVGFGVSQILPIILICLESQEWDTIIIDHPEIHLHPNAQALLADYFIELIRYNRRVIVETHSQYFVNRLVRRVAENEELADKINILFVRPPKGEKGATIAPLEISEDGDISNWPPDFFPEPDEDTARTLAAKFRGGQK